jgi:hypothetical protein
MRQPMNNFQYHIAKVIFVALLKLRENRSNKKQKKQCMLLGVVFAAKGFEMRGTNAATSLRILEFG